MNNYTLKLVMFLTSLFALLLIAYFIGLREPISSVKATRPVLVFTLIVAMLGFGGMLMGKSLFGGGDRDDFAVRFRSAREIFLVYSGIFGTIIGFYFGAADEADISTGPSASVTFQGRKMDVQISGGTPPFVGYLQQSSPKLDVLLTGDSRLLTAQIAQDAPCPNQAELLLVDGRGRRGTSKIRPEDLTGWDGDCSLTDTDASAGSATSPNAADPGNGGADARAAASAANISGVAPID